MNIALQRKIINVVQLRLSVKNKKNLYVAPAHEILPHLIYSLIMTENHGVKPEVVDFMELNYAVKSHFYSLNQKGFTFLTTEIETAFCEISKILYSEKVGINTEAFSMHYTQPYLIAAVAIHHLNDSGKTKAERIPFLDHLTAAILLSGKEEELKQFLKEEYKHRQEYLKS